MKHADSGPTMPGPDPRKAARSRALLMAQVRNTPLDPQVSAADVATFGRSGLEDAPRELKKRWFAVGAGLAAATVGVAVVIGSGSFGEDLGLTPADPSQTQDSSLAVDKDGGSETAKVFGQACLFNAEASLDASATDQDPPDLVTKRQAAHEAGTLRVVADHTQPDYLATVVENAAMRTVCIGDDEGLLGTSTFYGSTTDTPEVLDTVARTGTGREDTVSYVVVGRVAKDAESVFVTASGGAEAKAHLADGFYSVGLAADTDETLTFKVTMIDGSVQVVQDPEWQ